MGLDSGPQDTSRNVTTRDYCGGFVSHRKWLFLLVLLFVQVPRVPAAILNHECDFDDKHTHTHNRPEQQKWSKAKPQCVGLRAHTPSHTSQGAFFICSRIWEKSQLLSSLTHCYLGVSKATDRSQDQAGRARTIGAESRVILMVPDN